MHRLQRFFLGLSLASIASMGCTSANPKLANEVANLRVEVDALKANQRDLQAKVLAPASSPADSGGQENRALAVELRALRADQAALREQIHDTKRSPTPSRRSNRPDAAAVYSIDLGTSPAKGARHAKVTIVESFEFA